MYVQDGILRLRCSPIIAGSQQAASASPAPCLLSYIACADKVSVASQLTELYVTGHVGQSPSAGLSRPRACTASHRAVCAPVLECSQVAVPSAFDHRTCRFWLDRRTEQQARDSQLSFYSWLHSDMLQHGLPASWAEVLSIR